MIPPSEKDKAFEKLLDRALAKCDSTKKDLDSHWTKQILAVALSVALVAGLDPQAVSEALFHAKSFDRALSLILPLVNLYFMMRFGFLTFAFSEARSAAEKLSKRFIDEKGLSQYIRDDRNTPDPLRVDLDVLYSTNSYFEPLYPSAYSVRELVLVYVYSFFIPIVFALSHSTSIYLLLVCTNLGYFGLLFIVVYILILITLYMTLYNSLRKMLLGMHKLFLFIAIVSLILTIGLFWVFLYINPIQSCGVVRIGSQL